MHYQNYWNQSMNLANLQDTKLQKLVVFLYTNNELSGREESNPIYNCIEKNTISKNKSNQGGKRLVKYSKSYKTLIKEIEDDTNKM